jgi:hypothetical protein
MKCAQKKDKRINKRLQEAGNAKAQPGKLGRGLRLRFFGGQQDE